MKSQNLILIFLLILFGAVNTILLKLQNIQIVDPSTDKSFFHPFMQTLLMFVGEMLVGVVTLYLFLTENKKEAASNFVYRKAQAPNWMVLFPAVMDLIATLLSYIALNMVASSVWQISRGGNIVTTAILSTLILKRKLSPSAKLGCFLAFVGITSVQLVAVLSSDQKNQGDLSQELLGICLLLVSLIFNSCGLISQKWIFNKYEISPLKMVFLQGLFGFVFMSILTFSFQYVNCPWENKANCVKVGEEFYLENINSYFSDLNSNFLLSLLNVGLILSIAVSVPIAVTVSKRISPISRSLADICRTLFIWIFGIAMTLTIAGEHPEYKLEDLSILVNILKFIGFTVLILGTMLYHEMLPCFRKQNKQSLLLTDSQIQESIEAVHMNRKSQTLI